MPKKSKKEKAKELWDYYQIRKVYEDKDDNEDMLKLVLVCGNCDHHDLLVNFRDEVKHKPIEREPFKPWPDPNPVYPKPWRITYKAIGQVSKSSIRTPKLMSSQGQNIKWNMDLGYGKQFKRFFKCPNCGSSFVYPLNPEIIVAETL